MNMIFSADNNWAIGKAGGLLYHCPPDMGYFREKTTGGAVVMGRKTWESLPDGKPLRDRVNIVLTRSAGSIPQPSRTQNSEATRFFVCLDLADLVSCMKAIGLPSDRVWVAGGAEIYRLLMPYCEAAYVTRFFKRAEGADTWMENLDAASAWSMDKTGKTQEWEGLRFRFDRYRNNDRKTLL
jgi:dihydrofolate reductase